MRRPPLRAKLAALGLAALAAGGCGRDTPGQAPVAQDAAPADEVVFRRGLGGEPDTLDPQRSVEASTYDLLRDLYEGLVTEAPDGSLVPGTAEDWEVSPDGRVYTFRIRPDARWSNGDPVTAADFEAGLRRAADPATGASNAAMLGPIENAEAILAGAADPATLGVEALDERRLRIRLARPTPYLLGLLTHSVAYPVHRPSLAIHGERFARPGKLVSNGAFRLRDWVVQSHITLDRNPYYRAADEVQLDRVVYYSIEQPAAELKRYRADELDFTESLPNAQFGWIREHMPEDLVVAPYLGIYYYLFNTTRPPLDDRRLRAALSMVVDREILAARITGTGEQPALGMVPPGVHGYAPQAPGWADWPRARRLEEARRLYAQSGYGPDHPLRLTIHYNTGENHRKTALAVAAMWREALGVEAEPVNEELKVLLQRRRDPRRWTVLRLGWVGDYDDASSFLEIFTSDHGQNDAGYADPEFDRLMRAAAVEQDPGRRNRLMEQAERILLESQPAMPLFTYVSKRLVKPWVRGYRPSVLDHNYSRHLSIDTAMRGY